MTRPASLRQLDIARRDQRVGQRDAEAAGEVVVAGARGAQRGVARADRELALRRSRSDATCMMLSIMCATAGEARRW